MGYAAFTKAGGTAFNVLSLAAVAMVADWVWKGVVVAVAAEVYFTAFIIKVGMRGSGDGGDVVSSKLLFFAVE